MKTQGLWSLSLVSEMQAGNRNRVTEENGLLEEKQFAVKAKRRSWEGRGGGVLLSSRGFAQSSKENLIRSSPGSLTKLPLLPTMDGTGCRYF